jgi:hypothetical protein
MPAHVDSLQELAEEAFAPKRPRRGPSRYMRRALTRLGSLSPEEYAAFKPENIWQKAAMNLIDRAINGKKADSITAYTIIRDTLGEKTVHVMGRISPDIKRGELIVNDAVPFAVHKAEAII